jgi:hypothetical protein
MASASISFTEIEKEIIYLNAIAEMIDAMVNHEVFDLLGADPNSEVSFRTMTHQQYFNIILVDFLSPSDSKVVGEKRRYLEALLMICENPRSNKDGAINNLASAVKEFSDWLEHEIEVQIWMPSLNKNAPLSIKRREFIKICGNISKHNFSRLGGVGQELCEIFARKGIDTGIHGALLALYDFYEHFHVNILNYHGSTIVEFLNNIRWGIHEYLQPEFSRSIVYMGGQPLEYRYTYPEGLVNEFAKICYWDLMNAVRSAPIVRKFVATQLLKSRY